MPFPTSLLTFSPPVSEQPGILPGILRYSLPTFGPSPLAHFPSLPAPFLMAGLHPHRQAPFPSFLAAAMSWISLHLLLSTPLFIPKLPFGCVVQGAEVGMRGNHTHSSLNPSNVRSFLGFLVPFLGFLTTPLTPFCNPSSPLLLPPLAWSSAALAVHSAQSLSDSQLGISALLSLPQLSKFLEE